MPPLFHPTSCTRTKSNLYLLNSLAAAVIEPALYSPLTFQMPNIKSLFRLYWSISPGPRLYVWMFRNKTRFYGELLAPFSTPKL